MPEHYCEIEELFAEMDERSTKQKHRIAELVLAPERAWTAKQIMKRLRSASKPTIHRIINHLKDSGLIQVALEDGTETAYERAQQPHHDHLKCKKCGVLKCVPCPGLKQTHTLLFQGTCRTCS